MCELIPTSHWVIVIGGFQQRRETLNGTKSLYLKLRRFASPSIKVVWLSWNDPLVQVAEQIWQDSLGQVSPKVHISAFSWGCGRGAVRLARALDRRGILVQEAVLCDPVNRWPWKRSIRIPENVESVWYLVQRKTWPQGAVELRHGPETTIYSPIPLPTGHIWSDDAQVFHETAIDSVSRFLQEVSP